ncbi:MAG: hypothetical protein IPK75_07815 [Acidobacteria bacterium]|nr:hypothetical protein [Acidobacteriota bacterium]
MSEAQFYTFLTGGLGLLVALMTLVSWHLWRMREDARAGRQSALEGISHEMRINLQRMVSELSQVAGNPAVGPDVLLPISHPQLDGVNRALINANRNGIAVIGVTYQELEARKLSLRAQLAQGNAPGNVLDDAMDAAINGIAALYFWEVHHGALPAEIGRVRSWDVRDWMKAHGFKAEAFPGMHLRDEVVERLRMYGLELTPKPLTHTAWEYYNMHYDRQADRDSPLGRRRAPKPEPEPAGETEEADEAPREKRNLFGFGRKAANDVPPDDVEIDLPEDETEPLSGEIVEDDGAYADEAPAEGPEKVTN